MPDENPFLGQKDANYVESVRFAGLSVATYPHPRGTDQFASLSPVHGFDWRAKFSPGTRLYFNEGDRTGPLGDEVYVAVPIAESALQHAPSFPEEPSLGDSLSADTQYLVMRRHGASITPAGSTTVTVLLRLSSFLRNVLKTA